MGSKKREKTKKRGRFSAFIFPIGVFFRFLVGGGSRFLKGRSGWLGEKMKKRTRKLASGVGVEIRARFSRVFCARFLTDTKGGRLESPQTAHPNRLGRGEGKGPWRENGGERENDGGGERGVAEKTLP